MTHCLAPWSQQNCFLPVWQVQIVHCQGKKVQKSILVNTGDLNDVQNPFSQDRGLLGGRITVFQYANECLWCFPWEQQLVGALSIHSNHNWNWFLTAFIAVVQIFCWRGSYPPSMMVQIPAGLSKILPKKIQNGSGGYRNNFWHLLKLWKGKGMEERSSILSCPSQKWT